MKREEMKCVAVVESVVGAESNGVSVRWLGGIAHVGMELYSKPKCMTVEEIWENDDLMALNSKLGLSLTNIEKIVRVVEEYHNIKRI
jgi:hypothetical protein